MLNFTTFKVLSRQFSTHTMWNLKVQVR